MRVLRWLSQAFSFALFFSIGVNAQLSPTTSAASSLPIQTKLLDEHVDLSPSGLAVVTVHIRMQANNAAAAQQMGQQPIPYSEALSDLDIVEAYTQKPDGRKIPVAPSAIYTQLPQGASQEPMFDDLRQKVLVFPDVEAGDIIDLTFRRRDKQASMPGQFMFAHVFSRAIAIDNADVTIVAPKSYPLFIETHELQFDRHDNGSNTTYHWHFSQPTPVVADDAQQTFDNSPRFLLSTFKDYNAFARSFAQLVAPAQKVTSKVQALADQITHGVSDHRTKAQKLYDWVSRHIRYVGVEIGAGAIVPHDADSVLANGYGDCKDHVTLYAALLKAEGIASEMVLINATNDYSLPPTAILGDLDHAITWLPEFGVYADTTAGVAPFGTLPFQEYGKPIVHATEAGNALGHIPVLAAGQATVSTKTLAHIDATGKLEGTSTITATGPFSVMLRQLALEIEAAGTDNAGDQLLKRANVQGTAKFSFVAPDELAPSYSLSTAWSFGPYPTILQSKRFAMPQGIGLLGVPGDFLMGPIAPKQVDPAETIVCYSGHAQEDVFIDAPPDYHFLQSPPDASIRTAHIAFTTHWSVSGNTLHLHRDFTSTINTALCGSAIHGEAIEALEAIRQTYAYGAAIAPNTNNTPVASLDGTRVADAGAPFLGYRAAEDLLDRGHAQSEPPPTMVAALYGPGPSFAPAPDLFSQDASGTSAPMEQVALAATLTDRHDFAGAEQALSSAIAQDAGAANLYELRGNVRDQRGNFDAATADFTHAIALAAAASDASRLYGERAMSYWLARDWRPALGDFSEAVKRDPSNADALAGLGRSELFAGRTENAIADFGRAASLDAGDPLAAIWLFIAESHGGKDTLAALMSRTTNIKAVGWTGNVLAAYRGETPAAVLVLSPAVSGTPKEICAQNFYLGELMLSRGDNSDARKRFLAARAVNLPGQMEYVAAGIELARLSR
jgi:lipoprotein NlpI/transglutaminase-like putative cysteine protease